MGMLKGEDDSVQYWRWLKVGRKVGGQTKKGKSAQLSSSMLMAPQVRKSPLLAA